MLWLTRFRGLVMQKGVTAVYRGFGLFRFSFFGGLELPHLRHRSRGEIFALLILLATLAFAGVVILGHLASYF